MPSDKIKIRGAREHNLKDVDIDIPKNKLVVITGLSGSGKSSLAFDTLYAEGQRRYVDSLSVYARQFVDLTKKPDVDLIEGLSPAISIEQKTTSHNPRSIVGTVTEIYDFMRLLWARAGTPYSPTTGLPIEAQTVSQMVDKVLEMETGTKLLLMSPVIRSKKGEYKKEIKEFQKKGFQRLKIDGETYLIEETPELDKNKKHDISVIVDRIILKPEIKSRLAESFETALNLSDGLAVIQNLNDNSEILFSSRYSCPVSGFTIDEIEPRLFSFNNPRGFCPECEGLGVKLHIDPDLVVPNKELRLDEGAIAPWSGLNGEIYPWHKDSLDALSYKFKLDLSNRWCDLEPELQKAILYGCHNFEGVIPNLNRRFLETDSEWVRNDIQRFQNNIVCECCHGKRLRPEALCVKIAGKDIADITNLSIQDARAWFGTVIDQLSPQKAEIAKRILRETNERLDFLINVGLGYLSLGRSSGTLSGGESQRIRLASQIGSGLTGVLYVLDEPSIGLHQRDNDRLLSTLYRLRDLGNTVVVVEHDEDTMRAADQIIDMGVEAGANGGHLVAQGTAEEICKVPESLTGQYLSRKKKIAVPKTRRTGNGKFIEVIGARVNNLKNVNAKFPLGKFTCVTGVSGGGKSSLVIETLYKGLEKLLNGARINVGAYDKITGLENIDKIIDIDQSPIGRTPRSNPATYTGVFSNIRDWFAELPEAKLRGYKSGRFSFNVKGGRCEACQGDGVIKIEMNFLPDVYVPCDECKGSRYNRETLEVKYKDKSIADVLNMTVDQAIEFFDHVPSIKNKLQLLHEVGLGYIHLGQSATTLSGGEAQRIKLSKELSKKATGKTVYILDEPTTGLHFEDISKLLEVLHRLVDTGNTVIVIEHNLDVIKTADYIIDMGPEGGNGGGTIVTQGTPEEVAKCKESFTGKYLLKMLKN
ncbi:MAG: excinuclease ABC subunit UvrA [Alphaproteobacteria bacterium]|nr:excinuclease ABC subunit UvrA [Alphaproteobacteria bacterium]